MATKHRYTDEEKEWLKENHCKYTTAKLLTDAFNEEFHLSLSTSAIRQQCINYLGLSFGCLGVKYTKEEDEFILQNYGKYTFKEISQMLFENFGRTTTWMGLRGHCYKTLGLTLDNPGKFAFKWRQLPIGTERIFEGYTWVKVSNNIGRRGSHDAYKLNWKLKHQIVWEDHHGRIPDGCQIIFLDGDKSNFNIDNLYCIDLSALGYLAGNKLWKVDRSLLPTAIKWAELKVVLSGKNLRNLEV